MSVLTTKRVCGVWCMVYFMCKLRRRKPVFNCSIFNVICLRDRGNVHWSMYLHACPSAPHYFVMWPTVWVDGCVDFLH